MGWLLVVLVGCGWSETRFEIQGIESLCEAASSCAGTFASEDCYDVLRATDRSKCDYDPKAAGDCVDALEAPACQAVGTSLPLEMLAIPDDCLAVYDCEWIELSAIPDAG